MPKIRPDLQPHYTESRRAQILDAATEVIATHGFAQATIRKIAQVAGLADGTIYLYFKNKDALLLGLLDRLNESERREADLSRIQGDSTRELLTAYLEHRLGIIFEHAELFRALLPELLSRPALREQYFVETILPTLQLGEAALQQLTLGQAESPINPAIRARLLAGSILGLLLLHLLGDELSEREAVAAEIAALLLGDIEES